MQLHICKNVSCALTLEEAMAELRVTEDFREEFQDLFARCMEIARPKYCFAQLPAQAGTADCRIGDARFDSRILRVNLRGLNRVFPGIVSCGREIYNFSRGCEDVLERYWIDGIAELLMHKAAAAMRAEIMKQTGGQIRAISPGSLGDFPLIEQKKLFGLLEGGAGEIGVELTEQCLMLPEKTTSAFYFESEEEYENCMLCLREGCFKRRAPFDERAFLEKYGLTAQDVRQAPGR